MAVFPGLVNGTSWQMYHKQLKRMCILLLLDVIFYTYQLDQGDWWYCPDVFCFCSWSGCLNNGLEKGVKISSSDCEIVHSTPWNDHFASYIFGLCYKAPTDL